MMKCIILLAASLLLTGCASDEMSSKVAATKPSAASQDYIVLSEAPEPLLDKMALLYAPDDTAWPGTVDEFVENGHPILPYAIKQLQEDEKISPEVAEQVLDRVHQSPEVPVDAQRIVTLLEVACYADVMCHRVESPLRVATLDYVKSNLDAPGNQNALAWIRESYQSGLPLDWPGDETGEFRGMLVKAMRGRLVTYANQVTEGTKAEPESK